MQQPLLLLTVRLNSGTILRQDILGLKRKQKLQLLLFQKINLISNLFNKNLIQQRVKLKNSMLQKNRMVDYLSLMRQNYLDLNKKMPSWSVRLQFRNSSQKFPHRLLQVTLKKLPILPKHIGIILKRKMAEDFLER